MATKIALVKVTLCEKDPSLQNNKFAPDWMKEAHLRYTAWSNKRPSPYEVERERVVLVYEGLSLGDIMAKAKFTFSCRNVDASWGGVENPTSQIAVMVTINAEAVYDVTYLGDHEDMACYAIMAKKEPSVGHFKIDRIPLYGRGTGFYHNSTEMESFGRISITNCTHAGDPATERALFEFIDKEVQARFAPQPETT